MRIQLTLAAAAMILLATSSSAQVSSKSSPYQSPSAQPGLSERTAVRRQALAELDDPDRLTRLGALEDILSGQDPILIEFATRKVVAGTDNEMKALALRKILSTPGRTFVFNITGCGSTLGWSQEALEGLCRDRTNLLSGAVLLRIEHMDPVTGQFTARAPYSRQAMPGKIEGTQVNFAVDLANKASQDCFAHTNLTNSGALDGQLSCSGVIFAGNINLY